MFFISPIKTIYSIKFYLQTLKEPLWKAFLFMAYIFILGSIFLSLYVPIGLKPETVKIVEQIAEFVPEINVNKGIITANNNQRLEITPEILDGYKIVFDTASTEPGYPTQMEKENILMYINQDTVFTSYNGQFQKNKIPADADLSISKDYILQNKQEIEDFISYFVIIIFILAFLLRLILLTLLALIIIFIIRASTKKAIGFKKMLILAIYMQAPIIMLDFILLILPTHIVGVSALISSIIYLVYANFIFANINQPLPVQENAGNEEEDEN